MQNTIPSMHPVFSLRVKHIFIRVFVFFASYYQKHWVSLSIIEFSFEFLPAWSQANRIQYLYVCRLPPNQNHLYFLFLYEQTRDFNLVSRPYIDNY